VCTRRQVIRVEAAALEITFEESESIWTESSYKYEPAEVVAWIGQAGFAPIAQWIDEPDRFALTLCEAV
jgi:L-histidine Nalpha-methyltransferase